MADLGFEQEEGGGGGWGECSMLAFLPSVILSFFFTQNPPLGFNSEG